MSYWIRNRPWPRPLPRTSSGKLALLWVLAAGIGLAVALARWNRLV